jgi:signal transduction histidine kinase
VITDVLEVANLEAGRATYRISRCGSPRCSTGWARSSVPKRPRGRLVRLRALRRRAGRPSRPGKLRQVVLNLLSNAVKFTPAGGTVRLSCGDGPSVVTVAVHDTGIGIPADKREAVFAPFVQLDQALTRTAEGAGLGLAISRDLARGMGGDLTLQSEVGTGSTFTLTLPRA